MGIQYRLSRWKEGIEPVYVVKTTQHFVTFRHEKTAPGGKPTGETYDRRVKNDFPLYVTWKAAHVALINAVQGRIESLKKRIAVEERELKKIEKMKEPK